MNQKDDICQKGRFRIKNENLRLYFPQLEPVKIRQNSRFRVKSSKAEIQDFSKIKTNCCIKSQTVIRVYNKGSTVPTFLCVALTFSSSKEKMNSSVVYLPLMRSISLSTSKKAVDEKTSSMKRNLMISNCESTCFSINRPSKN